MPAFRKPGLGKKTGRDVSREKTLSISRYFSQMGECPIIHKYHKCRYVELMPADFKKASVFSSVAFVCVQKNFRTRICTDEHGLQKISHPSEFYDKVDIFFHILY